MKLAEFHAAFFIILSVAITHWNCSDKLVNDSFLITDTLYLTKNILISAPPSSQFQSRIAYDTVLITRESGINGERRSFWDTISVDGFCSKSDTNFLSNSLSLLRASKFRLNDSMGVSESLFVYLDSAVIAYAIAVESDTILVSGEKHVLSAEIIEISDTLLLVDTLVLRDSLALSKSAFVFTEALSNPGFESVFSVKATKWPNNRQAAVSVTYDGGYGHYMVDSAVNEIIKRDLRMDFELVTSVYESSIYDSLRTQMRDFAIPHGIHFYGHGHYHYTHDKLSYDSCLQNFTLCRNLMIEWGLNPKAYAYPSSAGWRTSTQNANRDAGFIMARGGTYDKSAFYICPDEITEPINWFFLPSVPIADKYDLTMPQNHAGVATVIDNAMNNRSWIILMYHMVGIPKPGTSWYNWDDFIFDIDDIKSRDMWCGNLDDIGCYIHERNNAELHFDYLDTLSEDILFNMQFSDNLSNDIYCQPVTLQFNTSESTSTIDEVTIISEDSLITYPIINNSVQFSMIPDERERRILFHRRN